MGSVCDKVSDKEKYVGRDDVLAKARPLLTNDHVRVVGIFGMKSIGKSTFLGELINDTPTDVVTYCDIVLYELNDFESQYDLLKSFYTKLGCEEDVETFHKRYHDGRTQCGQYEQSSGHENRYPAFEKEIKTAVRYLIKRKKRTILLLDNVGKLVETEGIKDIFLNFLKSASACPNVKIVATSTNKIKLLDKFEAITLDTIDEEASFHVLYECVELRNCIFSEYDDHQNNKSRTPCFNENNKVFKLENNHYIRAIIKLCEGLPLALKTTGRMFTEESNLYTLADAVQLLILTRVRVLSPENAPSSDRLDSQTDNIKELNATFINFYVNLNKQMTSDGCTVDELNCPGLEAVPNAQKKRYYVQPLMDKCLMTHKDGILHVHGVLRECVTMMNDVSISRNPDEVEQSLKNCIKENAALTSLTIPDDCLNDARKLENFLENLQEPSKERRDDSYNNRMESTTTNKRQEYSSTSGPQALSYQKESEEQSQEKLERATVSADAEKELSRDMDDKTTFSSHQTSFETLNFDTTELGSIVSQPQN